MNYNFPIILLTLSFVSSPVIGSDSVDELLENFRRDPTSAYLSLAPKVHKTSLPSFIAKSDDPMEFINYKVMQRQIIHPQHFKRSAPFSSFRGEDNYLPTFLNMPASSISYNLASMAQRGLEQGSVNSTPWSDSYWPMYQGEAARRYADRNFERYGNSNYQRYRNYVLDQRNRFPDFIENLDSNDSKMLNLSPAEKYDLLVGDQNSTLSKYSWGQGQRHMDRNGRVATWMGICHGWAPASYLEDRPRRPIKVSLADGRHLVFYPSDIKALTTMLWANASPSTVTIGTRCNLRNPARDSNGRVLAPECQNVSPALFHITLAHKIGIKRESFVMDATFDYEVWNQPVLSYRVSYFNPQTNVRGQNFRSLSISRAEFRNDPFRQHRDSRATQFVGVALELTYLNETNPSHEKLNTSSDDSRISVNYLYDLELDDNYTIVGGEWYSRAHPDFFWTPRAGARAWSNADRDVEDTWDGVSVLSSQLREAAKKSASPYGEPLAKIVRKLIQRAQ